MPTVVEPTYPIADCLTRGSIRTPDYLLAVPSHWLASALPGFDHFALGRPYDLKELFGRCERVIDINRSSGEPVERCAVP